MTQQRNSAFLECYPALFQLSLSQWLMQNPSPCCKVSPFHLLQSEPLPFAVKVSSLLLLQCEPLPLSAKWTLPKVSPSPLLQCEPCPLLQSEPLPLAAKWVPPISNYEGNLGDVHVPISWGEPEWAPILTEWMVISLRSYVCMVHML